MGYPLALNRVLSCTDAQPGHIFGLMADDEIKYLYSLAKHMDSALEIGCFCGLSTYTISLGCPEVTSIDNFSMQGGEPEWRENLKGFGNKLIIGRSQECGHLAPDSYDMLFIDGGHDYDTVTSDLTIYAPRAKKIVLSHDYGYHEFPRLAEAMHDYFGREPDKVVGILAAYYINNYN